MDRREPACRGAAYDTDHSATVHVSHEFFPYRMSAGPLPCPGWSAREDDAAALAMRLDRVALDHAWPLTMPPGIRLECHPSVPHALMQLYIPSYDDFMSALNTGEDPVKPRIPVVVTAGMAAGEWRITADDGLIAEGVVRDG